jgi:AraC-like DNA-binding protein
VPHHRACQSAVDDLRQIAQEVTISDDIKRDLESDVAGIIDTIAQLVADNLDVDDSRFPENRMGELASKLRSVVSDLRRLEANRMRPRQPGLNTASGVPRAVRVACAALDESMKPSDVSVHDIARRANVSTSHFQHLLKRHTGATFGQHIRAVRIHSAIKLLETTPLLIKQVASECGYEHVSSFDRDFRRLYGCPPSAWRKRVKSVLSSKATD